MKPRSKRVLGILLGLVMTVGIMSVLGLSQTAYADEQEYVLTFSGNGQSMTPYTGDLPFELKCDQNGMGYLDQTIRYLYGKEEGNCVAEAPTSSLPDVVKSGLDKNNMQYIRIERPFDGTVTVSGKYIGDGSEIDYSFSITCAECEEYPLWVGKDRVTSENAGDVLGDGTVRFTPASGDDPAVLTLNGANITTTYGVTGIHYIGTDSLIIELVSGTDNKVIPDASFSDAIYFSGGNVTITGEGKLTARGQSNGIYADEQSVLTIDGGDVTAEGGGFGIQASNDFTVKSGILNASGTDSTGNGIYSEGNINIAGGDITAHGGAGAICTYSDKTLTLGKGVTVKAGENESSAVDVTDTFASDHNNYKWAQTQPPTQYPLWIGNTQVTSANYSGPNWFYNADTNTLRLNGSGFGSGVYRDDPSTYDYGIRCELPELTIDVRTDSTVEGSGIGTYSYGIMAPTSNLTIIGDGKLTAKGGSGNEGDGSYGYTTGISADTINVDGKLEAIGGRSSRGEQESGGVNASKVNVSGELIATGEGYGIICYKSKQVITIKKGSKVTVTGGKSCVFNGVVKTAINGTAWDDVDGTKGATLIKAGNTGHDLSNFKKAQFPTKAASATVATKPTAKNLKYNGKAQALVTSGKASGGTMQYAIGKDKKTAPTTGWSKSIPKGTKAGTYYVWYKAAGDASHIDSAPAFVTATIKAAAKPTPKPAPAKVSGTLMAKAKSKGKKNLVFSWNKIQGAAGYDIFFARCNYNGKKLVCKNVKTIKGNETFTWTKTGLKKKTAYKAYVKAYVMKDGKKTYVKTSPRIHAFTGKGSKNYTNAKSVKVKKAEVTLKKGKTFKIKGKVIKVKKNKKLMSVKHEPKLRYTTSNGKVATVSSSGKITAKGKGSCIIYVYAHNGVSKQIKVTVK